MKGHLLIDIDSFGWEKWQTDRSCAIGNMFEAYRDAKNHGDEVHGHPEIWNLQAVDGQFLYEILYDPEKCNKYFPWLGEIVQQSIVRLLGYAASDCGCKDYEEMCIEFMDEAQPTIPLLGLLGMEDATKKLDCFVSDEKSWLHWHRLYYVTNVPEDREAFIENLSPFFPNLYLNPKSVKPGLNGLHESYKTMMRTIIHHLAALNDDYHPKFTNEPHLGGDGVCDWLEQKFASHKVKIGASRDANNSKELKIEVDPTSANQTTNERKVLYCDLHTKFYGYYEPSYQPATYEAKGNRIYFHQPIEGFLNGRMVIARIGGHRK